jgi:triosephosphate isomerase (TIM)
MSALPRPVIAGNWKMHLAPEDASRFFDDFLPRLEPGLPASVVFFPAALTLAAAREALRERPEVRLGVQNVHWEESGAFTGEISAPMARAAGAELALVGHSERRHVFGETDEESGRKVRAALNAGLIPVLCVGETLEEREAHRADAVVERQLRAGLEGVDASAAARLVVAYEPVWAIGTGRTAAPEDAEEMHGTIRRWLAGRFEPDAAAAIPILYGGSVKPDNAAELLRRNDVDGVLVGGASLDAAGFARIAAASA